MLMDSRVTRMPPPVGGQQVNVMVETGVEAAIMLDLILSAQEFDTIFVLAADVVRACISRRLC